MNPGGIWGGGAGNQQKERGAAAGQAYMKRDP